MLKDKKKNDVCKKHVIYIELISYCGKGIMFSTHIEQYMIALEDKNKTQVWRELRELENLQIIDIFKFFNNNYVKLKKHAISYLLNRSVNSIKSINSSRTSIQKSAFMNEFILSSGFHEKEGIDSISDLICFLYKNTTLLYKRDESFKFLNTHKKDLDEMKLEFDNLYDIYLLQLKRLQKKKAFINVEKRHTFNLNNMQARNIYITDIDYLDKVDNTHLEISIFDINDNFTGKKIADNIESIYTYMSEVFPNYILDFNIITTNDIHFYRIINDIKISNDILSTRIGLSFNIAAINLNLKTKVFSNINILF